MSSQTNQSGRVQSAPFPDYIDETNTYPGLYGRPLTLDRIFQLLVNMINTLQKVAATQANRLNFLSAWQKAYTFKMNQIQSFNQGDGKGANNPYIYTNGSKEIDSPSDPDSAKIRTALNNANSTYTQQMQANNQLIADDAKALQANVQQSNDAVQAQGDICTQILTNLQTILSAIYAG